MSEIITINTINSFIKTFVMNICIYYLCNTINDEKDIKKSHGMFVLFNTVISTLYICFNKKISTLLLLIIMCCIFTMFISKATRSRMGSSFVVVLISYAISNVALLIGVVVGFIPYKMLINASELWGIITMSIVQLFVTVMFFKIKRFRTGLRELNVKINKEITDVVVIYVSVSIILITGLFGSLYDIKEERVANIFITFIILGITMYIMIQRTITMQYKHSLLLKTLEEYKEEISAKDKEIEKLSAEKFNTSKIRHEFYNRQKALELMVKQNITGEVNDGDVSENILNIVNELTAEYSKECEIIKGLVTLPKTDVIEIDNMFKYMQTECAKNNIEFKLNIQDSIHPLINNHISKNRLETLLGDHIRDAINAVNKVDKNKEILIVLGLKDGVYEICMYDTGVEFTIDTLLKLGKEQVTTGGTGIGFITTFETLKETKASLVITEFENSEYTKSISFVFNDKCEYMINSYRHKELVELNTREDIIINKIEG